MEELEAEINYLQRRLLAVEVDFTGHEETMHHDIEEWSRHVNAEIKRIDNQGACGVCKDGGQRLACIACKVRLCRDTECWNAHINDGKGRQVSDKIEFKISEDQGKKKEIPGRAWEQEEE